MIKIISLSFLNLRSLLLFLVFAATAHAGYNFAVVGEVHHVEATQNKILIIVSGKCRFVNAGQAGWTESVMDRGIIVIDRKDSAHSSDQVDWDALTKKARSVSGKKASIACVDPDAISMEREEVFMVRCRLRGYPDEKKMSATVWITEGDKYP